jgi:cytochrome d ubiquinol oxidase subunit II
MIFYWAAVLAISTLLYVLIDGLDLGLGIISGGAGNDARRDAMMSAVAPVWDGNETWLVVTGVVLWSAFPIVYATLLSAFYLPLILMLAGLILRGVAFEYRHRTERWRWLWDCELHRGILRRRLHARSDRRPPGRGSSDHQWLLCRRRPRLAEPLRGALRHRPVHRLLAARSMLARSQVPRRRPRACLSAHPPLSLALLLFLVAVFGFALIEHLPVMNRWLERPYLFPFPAVGILAAILLAASLQRRSDQAPFRLVAIVFAAAFGTLAFSFWPYMIPFCTIEDAAAPHSSLAFMFWGAGLFVFPLMLLYTAISYSVFRGRIRPEADRY